MLHVSLVLHVHPAKCFVIPLNFDRCDVVDGLPVTLMNVDGLASLFANFTGKKFGLGDLDVANVSCEVNMIGRSCPPSKVSSRHLPINLLQMILQTCWENCLLTVLMLLRNHDEVPFTRDELKHSMQQMKFDKACDEVGVVAGLVHYSSDGFMCCLLPLRNHGLQSGDVPCTWSRTLFAMLPQSSRAQSTTDFRSIANVRVLCKLFTYMILARIEDTVGRPRTPTAAGNRCGKKNTKLGLNTQPCRTPA